MDKKLTDSEIVKALENWIKNYEGTYGNFRTLGLALDLINRQKAEIERLKPFEEKIAEFKSHIRVEDMLVFANSLEEWLEFCDNIKAEAYKEVFEKLNDKSIRSKAKVKGCGFLYVSVVTLHDINKLKKELAGDSNAEEKQ